MTPTTTAVGPDVVKEIVAHLLHDLSNLLGILYMAEVDLDLTMADARLRFARSVYLGVELENLPLPEKLIRPVACVLWKLREARVSGFRLQGNFIHHPECDLRLHSFPPAKYLYACGYRFESSRTGVLCLTEKR